MSPTQVTKRWLDRVQRTTASFGVKHNLVANIVGRLWSGVMSLAFVPLYIHFLGIESYGLIGLFASVMALLSVLDMGLGTTLTREMARLSAQSGSAQHSRDLVRTLEVLYWAMGLLLGVALCLLASPISRFWIKGVTLPPSTVQYALMIMGMVVACEWPLALYSGGLIGLQRHSLLNGIRIITSTVEYGGAVLVLWFVAPTIEAFFVWQAAAGILQTLLMAACLWWLLPGERRASVRPHLLASLWRFSAGLTGISVLVALLTQLDKLILSRMLTLDLFGYYALAATVGGSLGYIVSPVFSAIFPRLSQLADGADVTLARFYHKCCQLMALVVVPVGVTLALFSRELLPLWVRDPAVVANIHVLVSLLVIGTMLNGLMTMPYALQLANGWTSLSLIKNVVALLLLGPLMILLIDRFGPPGAAIVWLILNLGYLLIEAPIMHRRLLAGQLRAWYVVDVGLPLALCLALGLVVRALLSSDTPTPIALPAIAGAAAAMLLAVALCMPLLRQALIHDGQRLRSRLHAALER